MSQLIAKIRKIFGSKGLLAKKIPNYLPRKVQLEMAIGVANALENTQVLIAEAGTGTGKTYAYLIPSIVSGKKVIISTGTKNLQDQLFYRDIPLIRSILAIPFKIALLKGRSNYVCLHRVNNHLQTHFIDPEILQTLVRVKTWAEQSQDGEIDQMPSRPAAAIFPYITSSAENCLGQECEFFNKCYLFKARRQAQESDVIIINHHLFFADNHLKDAGVFELLPDSDGIIFDEAHQLPEVATQFLGESISSRQIIYLTRDIEIEQEREAADVQILKQLSEKLKYATKNVFLAFGFVVRGSWEHIANKPQLKEAIAELQLHLEALQKVLEVVSIRGKGLENCWRRTVDLSMRFVHLTAQFSENQIHWYEVQDGHFSIHHTPMYIGGYFQKLIAEKNKTWVFTSATLSVSGDFSHFEYYLGLENAVKMHLESPFDYTKQALMYLPLLNCQPNDAEYVHQLLQHVVPLLKITKGRTFFLFTSHKALREAAMLLKDRIDYPLLIQGDAPKSQLLAAFCASQNAILLGTSSFWEGVDVKGNHLYCVIIDKIPFMVPDDPILKARIDYYKRLGRNPFIEYQLPHAVIMLRQGVGRLIRDITDKGVLMLCDPRLISKEYGKTVMNSLPPMPVTTSLDEVATFFQESRV